MADLVAVSCRESHGQDARCPGYRMVPYPKIEYFYDSPELNNWQECQRTEPTQMIADISSGWRGRLTGVLRQIPE